MSERLHLIGHDSDDVPIVSALLQDAAVRVEDMCYDPRARRFVMLANRFRWEAKQPSRVRSGLRIEGVTKAQRRNWPTDPKTVLELLAITEEDGVVELCFAGGPCVRLETECVDFVLEDLTGPWGSRRRPKHEA